MTTTQTSKPTKNGHDKGNGPKPPPIATVSPPTIGQRQTEIPGAEKPVAKAPPKQVAKAAESLRSAFNAEKRAKAATALKRTALETLMTQEGVPELFIEDDEGHRVRIWVDTRSKVKMAVVEEDRRGG